ncbi:MAG: DUF302 domain-containing protein [Candidatus Rokubacteria bacterium]|nr:DUF302 domain-containing protein [Candidatus Rokubacteria bacterium]
MSLRVLLGLTLAVWGWSVSPAAAADTLTRVSRAPFARVAEALEQAIAEQKMALVCHANAQRGAAARGVTIPGNQVMMVFRNGFAVRLLAADPRAGFEAPIRIYLYENPDGTATVTYRTPSAVLAPYPHPTVRAVAAELDPIFKAIVDRAVAAP